MAIHRLQVQNAGHGAQFAYGLRGSCTLFALSVAQASAKLLACDEGALQAGMRDIYLDMLKKGWCWPNGGTNMTHLLEEADTRGMPRALALPYEDRAPMSANWIGALRQYAGVLPIVMQVNNGQALTDAETGTHDQPGLQCHAYCVVGKVWDDANPAYGGYLVADGDAPTASQKFALYTRQTIAAALPISLAVFHLVNTPPAPPPAARAYIVVTGDSLSVIAQKVYGDPHRWPDIWNANRALIGGNPNIIHVGWHLLIP